MGTRQPQSIKEILKHAPLNTQNQKQQENIQSAWNIVVGKNAAQHTTLHNIRGTTLTVSVDSPVWVFQLNTQKQHIETLLQKQLNLVRPIKIKLRAGDTTQQQATP
jgi:predicted nucleic acid-binding Zn ribbon protein